MACCFGAACASYIQLTTNANGEITLGSGTPYVRTYYMSGTCTVNANPNIDGVPVLTGSLISTAPEIPDVVDTATLAAGSTQSGLTLTLGLDSSAHNMVSGYLSAHTVVVTDANGEPVQGAHVVWKVASSSGPVSGGLVHQFTSGASDTQTIVSDANGASTINLHHNGAGKVSAYDMTGFEASITIRAEYNGHSVDFTTAVTGPAF